MYNWIEQAVDGLCKRASSHDPFEIAKQQSIVVFLEELGSIRGYYNFYARQRFIHINCNLEEYERKFTCAHEPGHATLHPDSNTPFLRENTLFSINKLELEANKFAAYLLLSDEVLEEAKVYEYTSKQISIMAGVPEQLVKWRKPKIEFSFTTLSALNSFNDYRCDS